MNTKYLDLKTRYPQLQAAFPDQFSSVDGETFYRAINKVQPSLIRVEADEATYNLHIVLRFELEQEIMEGKIALRDLPEVWNARMKSYLGVDVPDDAHGVLQDIHWSSGSIGYFSTYSLGNIISCQIWEKALAAMPDFYEQFERGEFMALREWLRENLYRHGRKFTPKETLQKLVGSAASASARTCATSRASWARYTGYNSQSDEREISMSAKLQKLKTLLNEVQDLRSVGDLLEWDQQTCMPSGGGESRAEQFATVKKLAHERFVADEIGQLLADLSAKGAAGDYDSDDASLVRYTKYEYDRKRKLPSALESEIAQHTSVAQEIWVKARAENNFKFFQPALEKMYDLKHQEAEAIGYSESIYDALLQEYERDMTAAQVKSVFDPLRAEIAPLVKAILPRVDSVSDACLHQPFDVDKQREFEAMVIKQFGFDFGRGRVDVAVHPFEINFSPDDVRLTTRYDPNFLNPSLFGTMHESGHGMYEQNVSPTIRRTPLCGGTSLGIHESQSRLWENLVGRSRGFWMHFYSKLQAAFPQLAAADLETFYRAVNRVSPSFIRVEADELTYSLHIMLRFEIEKEVLEGKVRVADLPEVWNAKMRDYLGVTPPNDRLGVLQDVHWAAGLVGYFPTYALGTIISVQLFEKAIAETPDIPALIERGEFSGLFNWLKDHVYRHGKKFTPTEIVQRATGGPLNSAPYVKYLKTKFGEIYGV